MRTIRGDFFEFYLKMKESDAYINGINLKIYEQIFQNTCKISEEIIKEAAPDGVREKLGLLTDD